MPDKESPGGAQNNSLGWRRQRRRNPKKGWRKERPSPEGAQGKRGEMQGTGWSGAEPWVRRSNSPSRVKSEDNHLACQLA
jgi:hypothetical protein